MPRRSPVRRLIGKLRAARDGHRVRHRPTGLGVVIADRISYLDPRCWDQLTAEASVFLSRPYLEAFEATAPAGIEPRYAMIFRDRTPLAAVVAQWVDTKQAQHAPQIVAKSDQRRRRVAQKVQKAALGWLPRRMLVCGNLFSWGPHGVALAPNEDRAAIWPGVAEALYRIRRADRLSGQAALILIKDLPQSWQSDAQALAQYSYRAVDTDPDMVFELDPEWRSLDDYIASLASKYRKTTLKIIKDVTKAGCVVEHCHDLASRREALHALYRQVHDRAAVRLATITPDYLPALAAALGPDRFRCSIVRRGDELLGFVTTLRDGDTAIGYFIGFDYAANAEAPLYFRLLYAVIADSIELGCRRISLGRTALEPKARLGAQPAPVQVWLRHRVPVVNLMLQPLLNLVPHDEPPERNPFKNAAGQEA